MKKNLKTLKAAILNAAPAVLSGVLAVLSFPTTSLSFLAFVAWVPLLVSVRGQSSRVAFRMGWLAGLVYFGLLIYWLNYVHPAAYLALLIYCSLYPGLFSWLFVRLRHIPHRWLWGALLWMGMEYIRSSGPWSFSWGVMGHSFWNVPTLARSAAWWGVYGLSLVVMLVNLALVELWFLWRRRTKPGEPVMATATAVIALIICLIAGIDGASPKSQREPLRIGLLQGNYPQDLKWNVTPSEVLDSYLQLSDDAAAEGAELIVWPETALPVIFTRREGFRIRILDWVREQRIPLLFGTLVEVSPGSVHSELYNSAYLVSPADDDSVLWERYDKVHLVPYGEFIPFQRLFPFLERVVEDSGGGQYLPGNDHPVFNYKGIRMGVLICFESTLPFLARKYGQQEVDLIAVITNDAWFRRSTAPFQHASQSAFRAIENGVPVVRAANTGLTCAFDSSGRMIGRIPFYERGGLVVDVPMVQKRTFYREQGDLFVVVALGILAGWFLASLLVEGRLEGAKL